MCGGRRTHTRWLGLGGMHCKLPYAAEAGRAEPRHNWQEGGRGGFSQTLFMCLVAGLFCVRVI